MAQAVPTPSEFISWSCDAVVSYGGGKSVVFAPGGTSRWYFLEHRAGNPQGGYGGKDQFRDYGQHTFGRVIELVKMMFDDGVGTVFVVGFVPGQDKRDAKYNENLSWAYEILVNTKAQDLYARYKMGVLFRGGWEVLFEQVGASSLLVKYMKVESDTMSAFANHRLIWLAATDALIPGNLVPMVAENLARTGTLPSRQALCAAYYGHNVEHIDILIGHNKPSVEGLLPPLVTLGDVYFTITPSLYMNQRMWRRILYDHLFARQGHFRDYNGMDLGAMTDMRVYFDKNREAVLGLGSHHQLTQTWRPAKWPNLWSSDFDEADSLE